MLTQVADKLATCKEVTNTWQLKHFKRGLPAAMEGLEMSIAKVVVLEKFIIMTPRYCTLWWLPHSSFHLATTNLQLYFNATMIVMMFVIMFHDGTGGMVVRWFCQFLVLICLLSEFCKDVTSQHQCARSLSREGYLLYTKKFIPQMDIHSKSSKDVLVFTCCHYIGSHQRRCD